MPCAGGGFVIGETMNRIDRIMNKLKMKDADYKVGLGLLLYQYDTGIINLDTMIINETGNKDKEIPKEVFNTVEEGKQRFIEYCHKYGIWDKCKLLIDDGKEVYLYEPEKNDFKKSPGCA